MIHVLIVDDDISCISTLELMLKEYCPEVSLSGKATSIGQAVSLINQQQPQLVFLDVEIGPDFGFELFDYFPHPDFKVVFTTGHREYALQAIKASCLDFLVKPIDLEELKKTVSRATHYFRQKEQDGQIDVLKSHFNKQQQPEKIAINTADGFEFVRTSDIIYCEASLNYTAVYVHGGKKFIASRNIKDFEEVLTSKHFFRCHKSFLINIDQIEKVTKQDGLQARMSNGQWVDISVRKREQFMQLFDKF